MPVELYGSGVLFVPHPHCFRSYSNEVQMDRPVYLLNTLSVAWGDYNKRNIVRAAEARAPRVRITLFRRTRIAPCKLSHPTSIPPSPPSLPVFVPWHHAERRADCSSRGGGAGSAARLRGTSAAGEPAWVEAHLAAWAEVFRRFGAKPQRTPCSAEAAAQARAA